MDRLYTPPGWPPEVRPPGAPAWERTAVAWLLDVSPPEYRGYPVLRNHAVVLAHFALLHVEAAQAAVRRGLSESRGLLRHLADPDTIEAAVLTWQAEEARLTAAHRAVSLVEEALRGRRFVARL
jgi:LPS sulfotransferase NodH